MSEDTRIKFRYDVDILLAKFNMKEQDEIWEIINEYLKINKTDTASTEMVSLLVLLYQKGKL